MGTSGSGAQHRKRGQNSNDTLLAKAAGSVRFWNLWVGFLLLLSFVGGGIVLKIAPPVMNVAQLEHAGLDALNHQRYDEAIGYYSRLIRLQPNHLMAHYDLGICYLSKNRYDEAVSEFRFVTEKAPNNTKARYNLAVSLMNLNKDKDAVKEFDRYIEKVKTDPRAYYNRAISRANVAEKNMDVAGYQAALVDLDAAEKLKPTDSDILDGIKENRTSINDAITDLKKTGG